MRKPYDPGPRLYNGPAETAFRTLRILEALRPHRCPRPALALLDHAVVHTSDFGGPGSLHVPLPGRVREIEVRRGYVEEGLDLLLGLGLAGREGEGDGASYLSDGSAAFLLQHLDAAYTKGLGERAEWLASRFGHASGPGMAELRSLIDARVVPDEEDWDDGSEAASLRRFATLRLAYDADAARMECLEEAALMFTVVARRAAGDGPADGPKAMLAAELERVGEAAGREAARSGRERRDLAALMVQMGGSPP